MGVWAYVQKKDAKPKRVAEGYVIYERGGVKNKPPVLSRAEARICRLVYIENMALRDTRVGPDKEGVILKGKDVFTYDEYKNAPKPKHRGDRKKGEKVQD